MVKLSVVSKYKCVIIAPTLGNNIRQWLGIQSKENRAEDRTLRNPTGICQTSRTKTIQTSGQTCQTYQATGGTARSLGQMLLINRNITHASELMYKEERIIVVKLKTDYKTSLVANAYAPRTLPAK